MIATGCGGIRRHRFCDGLTRRSFLKSAGAALGGALAFSTGLGQGLLGKAHAQAADKSAVLLIFLHGGYMHLLFNMLMLLNFGGMIERHKGSLALVVLVLVTAIPSNLIQYRYADPFFGGMSGVLYGLFGYIWMKSRLQPHEGLALAPSTVWILLVWLGLCMLPGSHVANAAHVAGLACGLLLGASPYYWKRLRGQIRA